MERRDPELSPEQDFYRHPELYDLEYEGLVEDMGHYLRLAKGLERVMELGCGTGRLTLPIARSGAEVVGLDRAPAMLDRLRARVRAEPRLRVSLIEGDFRDFSAPGLFDLIILPFNALHHLRIAEDFLSMSRCVQTILKPGGVFALDLVVPDPTFWARDPEGQHEIRWYPDPEGGKMKSWENGFYDPITQINWVRYHYKRASGRLQEIRVPMRMFYPQEIQGLVRIAGWTIRRMDGDFMGNALRAGHGKVVLELTVRP